MIDEFFQGIAIEIHKTVNPEILQFISDTFQNNVFQKMSPEELQINCIKVILEVLTVMILFWISNRKRKSKKKKRNTVMTQKKQEPEKKFKPKVWTPDGYYYDDKKEKWIDPDF